MKYSLLVVVVLSILGCSGDDSPKGPPGVVIKGRVVKGGQPIHVPRPDISYGLVEVSLIAEGSQAGTSGEPVSMNLDGTFEVSGIGKGLAAGKYKVAVRQLIDAKDSFGGVFSAAKTPITIEIPPGKVGSEIKLEDIDLDKYLSEKPEDEKEKKKK